MATSGWHCFSARNIGAGPAFELVFKFETLDTDVAAYVTAERIPVLPSGESRDLTFRFESADKVEIHPFAYIKEAGAILMAVQYLDSAGRKCEQRMKMTQHGAEYLDQRLIADS